MDLSFFKSPGKIPKETLVKIIFISIASIIVASVFTPDGPYQNDTTRGKNSLSMVSVGGAPSMMPQFATEESMGDYGVRDDFSYTTKGYASGESLSYAPTPTIPYDGGVAGSAGFPAERKMIRTGSLALVVDDVSKSTKDIGDLAVRMGGFLENQNVYEYGAGSLQGNLTIRVPEAKFSETLAQIKLLALRVQNEQVNSSDVSAQVVDLESRLKSKRAEEAQYLVVMKGAQKVSDILEVTRMLSSVRSDIEQIEGQVNYLSRQTSMSTIGVSLTPVANAKEVTDEWKPGLVVKESFKNLLLSLTAFGSGVIIFAIQVLPVLILQLAFIALILMLLWKIGKKVFARLGGTLPPREG